MNVSIPAGPSARSRRHWLRAVLLLAAAPPLQAQGWPGRELRLVVPAEPGGGMDLLARALAAQLPLQGGAAAVVLNRSGANGNVGTASVARAGGDGSTLLVTGVGHLVSPLLHADAGYDALRDFVPLTALAEAPNVLVVHASLKALAPERLCRARSAEGRELAYASAGVGTTSHLAAELLMARCGARWLHVPYRGSAPAVRALLAGEVQLMLVPASGLSIALAGARASAVAVAHPTRLAARPDLPTLSELGITGADFAQCYAVYAPASTPRALADEMAQRIADAAASPALVRHIAEQSMAPLALGREAFAAFAAAEQARLSALLKREGLQRP